MRKHADAFAWILADLTGIPHFVVEHQLKTYPHIEPRVQKKRSLALDKRKYPNWVANPVLVKKADDIWRMCIDFKDLNKACLEDLYPLPEIDWKIESLMGFKYKCFLDAYKGYHQILMSKKDEEKTTFHTDEGVFCYTKMHFGLKNAGATYQRLVDTIFEGKIQRNLEANVDDMVIKSKTEPIRRIHQGRYGVSVPALTKDHKRNKDQYAVSRGLNTPYSRYGINIIFWKISNVVPTPRNPQYACMTRSSTNELFTPYKEPEREFRSSRRHFKTLSRDELRSPDFNLLSDQEYSEEEEDEAMAETMEQYMSKTRTDYGSGVARPKIDNKDQFELKGQFLKEL
ncbi:reverse transcriptase domain-containing protein [Tanacetum coccineum]